MFNPDILFSPWTLAPLGILVLLLGLFMKGACSAFNRAVDDNPSASIEAPSFLRALAILVIMLSFMAGANWGMTSGMSRLAADDMETLMSYMPNNHEGEPLLTADSVCQAVIATLWMASGLLQYVFCALLMMYGFNVRYRQANVIAFLFAQRAAIYGAILVGLTAAGAGVYLQRAESKRAPTEETESSASEVSGSKQSESASVSD